MARSLECDAIVLGSIHSSGELIRGTTTCSAHIVYIYRHIYFLVKFPSDFSDDSSSKILINCLQVCEIFILIGLDLKNIYASQDKKTHNIILLEF